MYIDFETFVDNSLVETVKLVDAYNYITGDYEVVDRKLTIMLAPHQYTLKSEYCQ